MGTCFKNYHVWNIWMKASRATRISATIFHKHKYISNPTVTPADAVITDMENLTATLKNKIPHHLQLSPLNELTRLSTILSDTTDTTTAHPVKPLQPAPTAPPKTNLIPPSNYLLPAPLPRVAPFPRLATPSSPTVTPSHRSP